MRWPTTVVLAGLCAAGLRQGALPLGPAGADGLWVVDGQAVSRVTGPLERRSTTLPPGWTVVANARWVGSLDPLAVEPTGRALTRWSAEEPVLAGLDGAGARLAAPRGARFVRLAGERAWLRR